jgi:hypothetical protein
MPVKVKTEENAKRMQIKTKGGIMAATEFSITHNANSEVFRFM